MGYRDTSLALPPELKEELRSLKRIPEETFASVLRRVIDDARKVPALEQEIKELKEKVKELEKQIVEDREMRG